ncbi:MAG: class II glutamine amidotransferase [Endomicrobiia bacterium]
MCRILAIKNFSKKKHNNIVNNFIKLALTGKVPKNNPPGHLDGWGVGYYKNTHPELYKSANSILDELDIFNKIIDKINITKILLIHLRKSAWENTNYIDNSHPFLYKNLIFAHNGTIFNYRDLTHYININKTSLRKKLDSEIFFYLIISYFIETKKLETSILKAVNTIKQHCNYSSLNCVIADGKRVFIYRDYTKEPRYYTLYTAKFGNSTIICSEIIDVNLHWKLLKQNELLII